MDQNVLSRGYKRWRTKHNAAAAKRRKIAVDGPPAPKTLSKKLFFRSQGVAPAPLVRRKQAMPKRFKKASVFRRGGGRKFRRSRGGRRSSAFRLKSSAGSRLRKFGRRFKRRGGRVVYPSWFKTITKGTACADYAGNYGNQIALAKNTVGACTHFKSLSIAHLQVALDHMTNLHSSSSSSSSANNSAKVYLSDVTVKHTWRNTTTFGESTMQFYALYPRRDVPVYNFASSTPRQLNRWPLLLVHRMVLCIPSSRVVRTR